MVFRGSSLSIAIAMVIVIVIVIGDNGLFTLVASGMNFVGIT